LIFQGILKDEGKFLGQSLKNFLPSQECSANLSELLKNVASKNMLIRMKISNTVLDSKTNPETIATVREIS
jgi:hypothetical protein